MKEKTKQYMAGLFDAEGCFTINSCFRPKSNCLGFTAQIILANTDLRLIKWIVKHFGGNYRTHIKTNGDKTAYYWVISNQQHALSFISHIQPYLLVKLEESVLMSEYYALSGTENPEKRMYLRDAIKKLKWDKSSVTTDMSNIPHISNAYCAGYIDGDGSITKTGLQSEGKVYASIAALHKRFGGHFSKRELSKQNVKWSDTYIWSLHNAEKVEKSLLQLIPYLVAKRDTGIRTLESIRSRKRMKIQSELIGDNESDVMGTLHS